MSTITHYEPQPSSTLLTTKLTGSLGSARGPSSRPLRTILCQLPADRQAANIPIAVKGALRCNKYRTNKYQ